MRILIACIARDETHRYLESALHAWDSFADKIVFLDDGSTDDTAKVARSFDKVAYHTLPDNDPLWGKEAKHRSALFSLALGHAEDSIHSG